MPNPLSFGNDWPSLFSYRPISGGISNPGKNNILNKTGILFLSIATTSLQGFHCKQNPIELGPWIAGTYFHRVLSFRNPEKCLVSNYFPKNVTELAKLHLKNELPINYFRVILFQRLKNIALFPATQLDRPCHNFGASKFADLLISRL